MPRAPRAVGATPAIRAAEVRGIAFRVHEYAHAAGAEYGAEAVAALDVDPARVYKTLVSVIEGGPNDAQHIVAVVPVAATLDLKALAHAVDGKRACMADPEDAQRLTGYVLGGISPLGQKQRLPTVIDASAATFETIYVSAGKRGTEIEVAPGDLAALTDADFADVARW
jgi:Cys-tRNA(Pro)/Cys-tRNA(Cys) deacylase